MGTPLSRSLVSDIETRTGISRRRIDGTPRDDMGFLEGGISLSYKQIKWIVLRLELELDSDADERAEVDPVERLLWQKNPDFLACYEACQDNKREAFRLLGTQMLPKALRVIDQLLDSPNPRAQAQGLNFLLRTQGMMIDKQPKTDPNELAAILVALRAANPPTFVQMPTIELGYTDLSNGNTEPSAAGTALESTSTSQQFDPPTSRCQCGAEYWDDRMDCSSCGEGGGVSPIGPGNTDLGRGNTEPGAVPSRLPDSERSERSERTEKGPIESTFVSPDSDSPLTLPPLSREIRGQEQRRDGENSEGSRGLEP